MKFSIIVPVYKVDYSKLKNCVNSLVNQTYKNYEIILVDDGSPDECPKICDEYSKKYKNIKVIHQKNKGLSGARNSGVRFANCDFYIFVDGDDMLVSNALELANERLNLEVDLLCSRLKPCSNFEDIGTYPYEFNKQYKSVEDLNYLKKMLIDFNGNNNSACGKFYNYKTTIDNNIFHNEKLKQGAEDLEFNFRFFSNCSNIIFLENMIYECVYNENSITRSFSLENQYLILDCFNEIKSNIKDNTALLKELNKRLNYVAVSTAISGFFNPNSPLLYKDQKKEYKKYISTPIMAEALKNNVTLDLKRNIIIFLIKNNLFLLVKLFAYIRYKQKKK